MYVHISECLNVYIYLYIYIYIYIYIYAHVCEHNYMIVYFYLIIPKGEPSLESMQLSH